MVGVDRDLPRGPNELCPFQSARVAFRPDRERDIERVVFQSGQHFLGREVEQFHARVWMLLGKILYGCGQEAAGERRRVANSQPHALAGCADTFQHLIGTLKKFARFAQQHFTGGSETD